MEKHNKAVLLRSQIGNSSGHMTGCTVHLSNASRFQVVALICCVGAYSWRKVTLGVWSEPRTCGCVWGRTTPLVWPVFPLKAAPWGTCCCTVSHHQILPLLMLSRWRWSQNEWKLPVLRAGLCPEESDLHSDTTDFSSLRVPLHAVQMLYCSVWSTGREKLEYPRIL